jgi:hypothetical protein
MEQSIPFHDVQPHFRWGSAIFSVGNRFINCESVRKSLHASFACMQPDPVLESNGSEWPGDIPISFLALRFNESLSFSN